MSSSRCAWSTLLRWGINVLAARDDKPPNGRPPAPQAIQAQSDSQQCEQCEELQIVEKEPEAAAKAAVNSPPVVLVLAVAPAALRSNEPNAGQ